MGRLQTLELIGQHRFGSPRCRIWGFSVATYVKIPRGNIQELLFNPQLLVQGLSPVGRVERRETHRTLLGIGGFRWHFTHPTSARLLAMADRMGLVILRRASAEFAEATGGQ